MNIGGRIVERLTELKWERKDLLERVPDLTSQALYNLIKRDSVRSEWDERIAEALGVSVLWLVYNKLPKTDEKSIAAQEPSNLEYFPKAHTQHPAVAEVTQLITATDEVGKGMMLQSCRGIAEERKAIKRKPKSSA